MVNEIGTAALWTHLATNEPKSVHNMFVGGGFVMYVIYEHL